MKIISGGQTGVDQAGLRAAKKLGLQTGGTMPKGWRTQVGPRYDFEVLYGMTQHSSPDYRPRTKENVKNSDGTIILGDSRSPGCSLTLKFAQIFNKPYFLIGRLADQEAAATAARNWILTNNICVLNVAGNREETNPGIGSWAEDLLLRILA